MPDFSSLLSTPTSDIKKPVPLPEGTFLGTIKSYKLDEAKTKEGPKPICQLICQPNQAMDDVDPEALAESLAGGSITDKPGMNYTFWLTPDAQYRLVEFATSLGIDTEGRTLGEIIPELVNQPVYMSVVQIDSNRNPGEKFANVDRLASTNEA